MRNIILISILIVMLLFSVFILMNGNTDKQEQLVPDNEPSVCQADAKLCPDGSYVGREGSQCEFSDCPTEEKSFTELSTFLGGSETGLGITVSPQKIVSDSRCPAEVVCIWAGTVEVRTLISTKQANGEHVLTLGTPQVFGEYTVTLVSVSPDKTQEDTPDSLYRFTFEVRR